MRTLIELSAIELVGKLMQVPYWQCLEIEPTNPQAMVEAREWFDGMTDQDRTAFVQRALAGNSYYRGPITGAPDRTTRTAVAQFQADNDLIASGRIDFDLYYRLISAEGGQGNRPAGSRATGKRSNTDPHRNNPGGGSASRSHRGPSCPRPRASTHKPRPSDRHA